MQLLTTEVYPKWVSSQGLYEVIRFSGLLGSFPYGLFYPQGHSLANRALAIRNG